MVCLLVGWLVSFSFWFGTVLFSPFLIIRTQEVLHKFRSVGLVFVQRGNGNGRMREMNPLLGLTHPPSLDFDLI